MYLTNIINVILKKNYGNYFIYIEKITNYLKNQINILTYKFEYIILLMNIIFFFILKHVKYF
jgi:flagellar motor switch protein FliG